MRGIQGLAAYNYRLKSPTSWLYAIEPAFRVDFADPNTDVDNDASTLITAVLGFYMSSKAQVRVAYERQSFQGTRAEHQRHPERADGEFLNLTGRGTHHAETVRHDGRRRPDRGGAGGEPRP